MDNTVFWEHCTVHITKRTNAKFCIISEISSAATQELASEPKLYEEQYEHIILLYAPYNINSLCYSSKIQAQILQQPLSAIT